MAKNPLDSAGGPLCGSKECERMLKNVRRERFHDPRFVADPLHYALNGSRDPGEFIVEDKKFSRSGFSRRDIGITRTLVFSEGPSLAFDPDGALLPLNLIFSKPGEF